MVVAAGADVDAAAWGIMSDDAQTLPVPLRALVEPSIRASAAEMARRRASVEALLAEQGLDHLVFCGLNRAGSAVQWITQWPVTTEAVGVFSPGTPDAMFVQYVNHAPLARRFADTAELVEWGGESSIRRAVEILSGAGRGRTVSA